MAITVRPWDGETYSSNVDPASYHISILTTSPQTECVLAGWGDEWAISGVASPITVGSGRAFVNGKEIISTASEEVAISTPTEEDRIDVIVLEIDYLAKTDDAAIVVVSGQEGEEEPALTWSPGLKCQVKLGTVQITTAGVCTCTPYAGRYLHYATRVSGTMLEPGIADGATLELSGGALKVKSGGIGTEQIGVGQVTADRIALGLDASGRGFTSSDSDKVDGYHASDIIAGGIITGAIIMWYGALGGSDGHRPLVGETANEDWHVCNGDTVNGIQTPDLRNRSPVGVGSYYSLGQVGGSISADLSHSHGTGTIAVTSHGTHKHGGGTLEYKHQHSLPLSAPAIKSGTDWAYADNLTPWPPMPGATMLGETGDSPVLTHAVSGNTAGGGSSSFDKRMPYLALHYLMKVS